MVKVIKNVSEIPTTGVVVIDFYADWCGPCRRLGPLFAELEASYPNITFLKVDVDNEDGDVTSKYKDVSALPTIYFLKDNVKVAEVVGLDLDGIKQELDKLNK